MSYDYSENILVQEIYSMMNWAGKLNLPITRKC